ncbi:MAG TPA: hypothetical protein PK256_14290 [Verrucomicrobiota bacterium]|nr:hypothetical protein [Verrucomicrobiota bacterium]
MNPARRSFPAPNRALLGSLDRGIYPAVPVDARLLCGTSSAPHPLQEGIPMRQPPPAAVSDERIVICESLCYGNWR